MSKLKGEKQLLEMCVKKEGNIFLYLFVQCLLIAETIYICIVWICTHVFTPLIIRLSFSLLKQWD